MSKKEIRKRCQELIYLGLKKMVMSEGFKEYKKLSDKLSNPILPFLSYITINIIGIIFAPRLLLLFHAYIFIKCAMNLTKMILKIEKEENIKIL